MAHKRIAVIRGDGIGPEIIEQAMEALDAVSRRYGHAFSFSQVLMGGASIDRSGTPLTAEALEACRGSDAVLLGAVGGPKWDGQPPHLRPEAGLLRLRSELGLYANLRPARLVPALAAACPLRQAVADAGFDILVVRELTGGVYFGEHKTETIGGQRLATDVMSYGEQEIRRILEVAFRAASGRRKRLTSVDKANVLATSRLWRAVADEMAAQWPEVELEHMLVDNAAMQLVRDPAHFDVIVTENLFGDILTDEGSALTGSIGLIPSASLGGPPAAAGGGAGNPGLYEPVHGSAPDIAGTGRANPVGAILSAALMLRHSLGLPEEAAGVERAVEAVLARGARTADIAGTQPPVSCEEMGGLISAEIQRV